MVYVMLKKTLLNTINIKCIASCDHAEILKMMLSLDRSVAPIKALLIKTYYLI